MSAWKHAAAMDDSFGAPDEQDGEDAYETGHSFAVRRIEDRIRQERDSVASGRLDERTAIHCEGVAVGLESAVEIWREQGCIP